MNKRKAPAKPAPEAPSASLLADLRQLIHASRQSAAIAVNVAQTMLYWRMGQRILEDVLSHRRAGYGQEIVATLSRQLVHEYGRSFEATNLRRMLQFAEVFPDEAIVATLSRQLVQEYGRGFEEKNLRRMLQFAEVFPDEAIVATLWRHLSWSHFRELLPLKQPFQREFYAEMCRIEGWSVRTLRERIDSMLYERTALSRKPDDLIRSELAELRRQGDVQPPMLLKDPYVLDFLGLDDRYVEKDLEDAILRELESFLLELGAGFSFIARQKRIQLDGDDFYIDLLFFNRLLKRLVVVELKLGRFKPAYKGQMELYLRWLDKHERAPGEQTPLGIILCTDRNDQQVELLELDKSGIHVAEYLTVLPPPEVLRQKLQASVEAAHARRPMGNDSQNDNNDR